jgi:putative NADH-flavin reductase
MKNKTIAVIGGTGKSGKFVVRELLRNSFQLKLLLRNPEQFDIRDMNVTLHKGDVRNLDAVTSLIRGCDFVVSTLGQPKDERSIFSDATKNIIKAMQENGVKRYVVTTGLSVDTPFDTKNEKVQFATQWMYDNYPETTRDKQQEYEILSRSDIDWTLIRLPLIKITDEQADYKASITDCLGDSINASDLGKFIVDEIVNENYLKKSPFLFNV